MALRKIYIGSVGPFLYDDTDPIDDEDGDFAGEDHHGFITDGPVKVQKVPTNNHEVLRYDDIGALISPVLQIGLEVLSSTAKSILFIDDSNQLADDANLFWDELLYLLNTPGIQFNLTTHPTMGEGILAWNSDDGTLDLGLPGGNVNLQIGQEMLLPRAQAIGSNINNGQLVYISGGSGANPQVSLAKADASATSAGTIAMATEDVTQNQFGYFTTNGLVRDINTGSYSVGDQLYLSPITAGAFTNVKPSGPHFIIKVGIVIRAHATEGIVFVSISQRTNNFLHIRNLTANSVPYADSNGFLTETNPGLTFDGADLSLGADNAKLLFGLGEDLGIYYDGTDAYIDTSLVSPSDLLLDCGTDKTLELQETVWDDLRIIPGNFQRAGVSDPTLSGWQPGGTGATFQVYKFQIDDEVFASCQMPHSYKEGTDLYFHIHWTPCDRGNEESGNTVGWKVDYSIANPYGIFGSSGTVDLSSTCTGTDDYHERSSAVAVSGTGLTISHIVMLRIYRSDTGTDDTWAGITAAQSPALLEFDIHFEINTMGSRQPGNK